MRTLFLLALLVLTSLAAPAHGQRLVSSTSDPDISIDSSFDGETITLFGTIASEFGSDGTLPAGRLDIVIVVRGPSADRVIRRKENAFGLWINQGSETFPGFPGFHYVASSAPLTNIAERETLLEERILAEAYVGDADERFGANLIRLMNNAGLFDLDQRGVTFHASNFYSTRINLPASLPNGNYLATTYLFGEGEIIARRAERFSVHTTGFERFVVEQAQNNALVYGITCVLVAMFTGWLGGVLFRR